MRPGVVSRRAAMQRNVLGRAVLWAASLAYGVVVVVRRWLYERGILASRRLPAKVICIGNLTTGGTGKTPAVLLAAQTLSKRNHRVAILSRGYGKARKDDVVTTLLDDNAPPWTECGDEPWMMHQTLAGQNIPILICPDRAKAGNEAITYYHSRVIILDDGFQHLKLKRDLDVVLVNALDPFGGGLLPLGSLREPLGALSRADIIMLTHADMVEDAALAELRERIGELNSRAPVLEAIHKADFLLDVKAEKRQKLSYIDGRKIVSLAGLADPAQFERQLADFGANLVHQWRYPDHHPYTLRELRSLEQAGRGMPVVTTFKDFIRFPQGWDRSLPGEVLVLAVKLEVVKGRNVWIDSLLELAGKAAA